MKKKTNMTDPKFAAWIRSLGVCIAGGTWGTQCNDAIQSCHVTTDTYLGKNQKHAYRQVPMCAVHHHVQGNVGERHFYDHLSGVDRAVDLGWVLTGIYLNNAPERDLEAMRAIERWRGGFAWMHG